MTDKGMSTTPCNNAAIRQAARMLGQLYDDALAPSGLRATQHNLLNTIHVMDAPTLREMAPALVMDLSALGQSLKPLVRDGLVAIVPDAQDRRAKRAMLTKAGSKKLQETARLWRHAQDRFEIAFGPRRAEELRESLAGVSTDEFRQAFQDGRPLAKRRQRDRVP
jgi:DNA-binding MarR family transcriptional regulator